MLCGMCWPDTDGPPICPHCGCAAVYTYRCRRLFKCRACHRQFSATSETSLACRKLPVWTLLMAFSLFVIHCRVARGSTIHAAEARAWDDLHASFEMKRINHREAYSKDAAGTNQAESYIDVRRLVSITISPDLISASMLAKWRGTKTCAATPPEPNSMHVAAWPWTIRRHLPGRDIGSSIAGGRKFVKPPDRRSARGRRGGRRPTPVVHVC